MPMLSWIGKEKVVNHHLEVAVRELRRTYSFEAVAKPRDVGRAGVPSPAADGGSENKIIHGDSLDALKALLPQYEGRVKCIYLDPPYNTGNEGWVYNDNVNDPHIQKWLGDVVGKEGEDFSRHDKWLCMMYPRLKLVQKLLSDDGAVFISIDDNEQASLRFICDEIFGANNFVATAVWQKRISPEMRKRFGSGHEYVHVYVRNAERIDDAIGLLPLGDSDVARFKNPDNDPRGPWTSTDYTAQGYRPNQMYTIVTPGGAEYTPSEGHCWKNTEDVYRQQLSEGRFWFGADGKGMPRRKTYLYEREGKNLWTWWPNSEVGHTQEATQDITQIFGSKTVFDYSKPERMIRRIVQVATGKDSIVLDCFAGSGTTAHAVLKQNAKDGGNRRFILVEMCDYAESVTAERVKRVIKGYGEGKNAVAGTGGDFSFYEIGEPLFVGEELNPAADIEAVKDYIWFSETRTVRRRNVDAFVSNASDGEGAFRSDAIETIASTVSEPALLGINFGTAYYFWHDAAEPVVLNRKLLHTIKTKAEAYVIYADLCALGAAELEKFHITFKKVSRDIVRI